jgi:polysaccharide biosynthesis protein PslH
VSSWKRYLFRLAGKDPEAVVVSFLSGEAERAHAMITEVRRLLPGRRHFAVSLEPVEVPAGVELVVVRPGPAGDLWLQLRRTFHRYRIGMAPVLFDETSGNRELRRAAWLLAPSKVLAYNRRLERHHLHWREPVASLLFWRGVPLDRIWLRPGWLWPWRRDVTVEYTEYREKEGRPHSRARARVAVLTPYLPWPLAHGGAVRIYSLLREIAVEFDVVLFAFTEDESEPDLGPLLSLCARIVLVRKNRYREPRWSTLAPPEVGEYDSPGMRRALAEVMPRERVSLLQTEYTQLAQYGGEILVEHDITWDLHEQVYRRAPSVPSWWSLWRWRRFERRALRKARRVVVMSEKDRRLAAIEHAVVIGNGVDLERFQPSPETLGRRLLFVGSFRHFPNVVAYRFFAEEVWPLVSDAALTVVGGPEARRYLREAGIPEAPGVTLHEFVADVVPLYREANAVVVPTLVSAGTNLKVLEAMAMERAVISTPSGCAGLGLVHGESVWIADSGASFAAGLDLLLGDTELRSRLARAARTLAEREYGWRRLGEKQRDLLREFAQSPLSIREAAEADLEDIDRIQRMSSEASQWNPDDYLSHRCWVAACDGETSGFLALRAVAPGEAEVLNVAVAPEWRRQGIARRLLDHAVRQTDSDLFLEVRESNWAARNLYKSVGFGESGRRPGYYNHPSEAAVVLALRKC